ncbi:hypothetical protein BGZ60DRAFT_525199 [Tricladium varicosporioides]|nr:hypothetical protein BGZ60DRAFT_525199 [Hymenoscyphus varicosporioides]
MAEVTQFPLTDADHHAATVFVAVTVTLLTLSLATLIIRIVFKFQSSLRFGWDDYLIVIGSVLAVADWALLLDTIAWYVKPSRTFTDLGNLQYTVKLGALAVPFWAIAVACIKISVAIQLLRFQQSRPWRIFLYIFIVIVATTSTGFLLFDLLQCRPLAATWDLSIQGAKCVSARTFSIVSNTQSAINITMDLILSLFPLTFLLKLRRPTTEKLLVGVLMGLGMTASAASIVKVVLVVQWVTEVDTFKVGFAISTWTCVEMFLGIMAACLPSMKSTFQRLLTAIGVDFTSQGPRSFFRSLSTFREVKIEPVQAGDKNSQNASRFDPLYSVDIADSTKSAATDFGKSGSGIEECEKFPNGNARVVHTV